MKNVLGTCKSGQGFSDLELGWNEGLRLTAATDGGLKKSIGTHSYSLYHSKTLKNITPEDYNNITMMEVVKEAVVHGYGAEKSIRAKSTSTREELLGILAIYYMMYVYQKMFGPPANLITVKMVVDSEAASKIRNRSQTEVFEKTTTMLKQEMDIEAEIRRIEMELGPNISFNFVWTKAHAIIQDSPTPTNTLINNIADALATEAWRKVKRGTIHEVNHVLSLVRFAQ